MANLEINIRGDEELLKSLVTYVNSASAVLGVAELSVRTIDEESVNPYVHMDDLRSHLMEIGEVRQGAVTRLVASLIRNGYELSSSKSREVMRQAEKQGMEYVVRSGPAEDPDWLIHRDYLQLASDQPNLLNNFGEASAEYLRDYLNSVTPPEAA